MGVSCAGVSVRVRGSVSVTVASVHPTSVHRGMYFFL